MTTSGVPAPSPPLAEACPSPGGAIVFIVGVEGHFFSGPATGEALGLPVAAIFLSDRMERLHAHRYASAFARTWSFPEYFRQHAERVRRMDQQAVGERIRRYERIWGIETVAPLVYYDRHLRQEAEFASLTRRALLYLEFIERVLSAERPRVVKGERVDFAGNVLHAACHALGIPFLYPRTGCVANRIEFQGAGGALQGWQTTYDGLRSGRSSVAPSVTAEALDWLDTFRRRPRRPAYADRHSRVRFDPVRFLKDAFALASRKARDFDWRHVRGADFDLSAHLRQRTGVAFVNDHVVPEIKSIIQQRSRAFRRLDDDDAGPFLYVPLQYTPEVSTLTYGRQCDDHEAFVARLAACVPSNMRLFVKEHTSMVGRRSRAFYRALASLYNVELISPAVSTFDLIQRAAGVVTITSTAGWEAFVLGKPVIVFGDAFYREFPGVLPADFSVDLPAQLARYLEGFAPDDEAIQRAVIGYFAATYAARMGDLGEDVASRGEAAVNARQYAAAIKAQLRRLEQGSAA